MLDPKSLLQFYQEAEKLKSTLRHSWLSDPQRQESVAEHTWMMALLSLIILPQIKQKLDQEKILKMIILHDLAEAITSDMPVWKGVKNKEEKTKSEQKAIKKLLRNLDKNTQEELFAIWREYEERETPEAKFVKVIDTLDVIVQHNVSPISTWDDNDFLWQLSPLQNEFFDFDTELRKLKGEIDAWSIKKAKKDGKLEKLDQKELEKRLKKLE